MTNKQKIACNSIIHSASAAAAAVGAGLAQIPLSDSVVLIPIQTGMVIGLAKVFGLELDEGAAKATVATAASTVVGRGISQVLIGWLPVAGNIINGSTAAGVTESLGWIVANDFAKKAA
ncbi:MAG: hypothetical protein J1F28_10065 [Oscillospiraceae bacterium]|nr:hypothetical protein [Oscillospiraceae bacterium]